MDPTQDPVKVFDYYPAVDAFWCTPAYKELAEGLHLVEWSPVVWVGRLFARDQDFGEHWFDNWELREAREKAFPDFAPPAGESWETALIVDPACFTETDAYCFGCHQGHKELSCPCGSLVHVGTDGPCTSAAAKKAFWTDVLSSLAVSRATLAAVAVDYAHDFDVGGSD
jgi:hypothetical protein